MNLLRTLAFWSCAVIFPLPLIFTYYSMAREPEQLRFYIVIGLTAYSWWLLSILLSVRSRRLERIVGLPAIYGLHGMLGLAAVSMAFVHRDNSYSGNQLAIFLGDWAFYLALGVLCFSVFFLSGWLVDRVTVLLKAKQVLEVVFRHQFSVWVHRLNLVVVGMIWLHAHQLIRVNQYFPFMVLLDLYTVTVLSVYAWRKWIAPDSYLAGAVIANEPEHGTRKVSVELDAEAAEVRPGDFFFLRVEGESGVSREWHPFSVTDDDQRTLKFTIRQHGDFTRKLTDVPVGARVRFEGPYGRFESLVQKHDEQAPLVLLGMGAGVAPLLSLAAAHHTTRNIHLLWAVRSEEDAYYRDTLEKYQAAADGRMQVNISVGRFHRENLTELLPKQTLAEGAFFVVGPNPAVLANQRLLRRMGVSSRRIHQEQLTM
ncbi:FAD-binding oxidoreductase [Nocardia sp. NPDC058518]|uniref:FAD-binding oxidoreductase n=1 Tax=Nocardia sp. NPDC058518 TaxID=3346534 RepID=UPI00365C4D80